MSKKPLTNNSIIAEQLKSYILIAGLPRSGSTLLQAILNQSEATYTLPETHFFEQARKLSADWQLSKCQALELLETLDKQWNVSALKLIDNVKQLDDDANIDQAQLYFSLIDHFCPADAHDLTGIEKTPGHLFILDQLLNSQSNFKVILTTRNPFDFSSSLIRQYWSPDSIIKISQLWNQSMLKINDLSKTYPTRVRVLDYADMTRKPEQVFKGIYDFLGLKWHSSHLYDINAKADDFVVAMESQWKSENVTQPFINKSTKKSSLSAKQRLLLHRECFMTALGVGYFKRYKF